ncbi:UDP-N-acetylglucosamine 4,6-dehydratase (inverting) [Luteolibacter sp. SL250]|uniref:UDP-N-acetylglucosamine 4,6-dehydratase (inverting) n=1 Tax=Luteolibacter sp. SL250 TaxID=2995170 RepID=UPI00226DD526|nr:UDP-N-acetylglucosamine 4,6-dehydratase (inverting) [Luteolibacter sp. SL250]WAC20192.1 UDP-N-acetylglucosamine 4,6-dehydratase (inverting) [Luteolibacter sp. SL250]
MLNGKCILITGGTGSLGKRLVSRLLSDYPGIKRLAVFSRDELKQFEMAQEFPPTKFPQIRYFIGDIRDADRVARSLEGIDVVIHAAALKQVPTAEYNPFECIKTNVLGAQNLIEACINAGVKNVVALSTDKAAAPVNLYGATKLCSDKLFVAANNIRGHHDIRFSVVRYGNVMGSRGSVIPFFMEQRRKGVIPITDPAMTRFNISLDGGVDLVLHALEHSMGGEIYIPKIPSYRITDVAEAIAPGVPQTVVGIRPGEKLHEEMITASDAPNTLETEKNYVIVPMLYQETRDDLMARYAAHHGGEAVPSDFSYNSGENTEWLSVDEMRALIRKHVCADFQP